MIYVSECHPKDGRSLPLGLICSSCGLGFTSEQELRDHQVSCRSTVDFLSQFKNEPKSQQSLN